MEQALTIAGGAVLILASVVAFAISRALDFIKGFRR